ncbi:MAG TPA: Fe-S protein assembly co-chaperone HscB [Candidatus Kapabacteria bacterium]|nr:Fe-S protein assembly co-chaperone HscB [Candidatus Kapabacteria bacterium]
MQRSPAAAAVRSASKADSARSVSDYFTILGVPRTFREEDAAQLERRFHDLQRRHHPDHAATRGEDALKESIDHSSRINEAYRTLREPTNRTKYLLLLYGYSVEQSKQIPIDLLELVMEVQEKVATMQAGSKLGGELLGIEQDLNTRIKTHKAEIDSLRREWDASAPHSEPGGDLSVSEKKLLESLTKALATRAYLQTLYDTLTAAKDGRSLVLKH